MKTVAFSVAFPVAAFSLLYVFAVRPEQLAAEAAEQRVRAPTRDIVLAVLDDAGVRGLVAMSAAARADNSIPVDVSFHATAAAVQEVLRRLDALPALQIRSVDAAFPDGSGSVRARLRLVDRM